MNDQHAPKLLNCHKMFGVERGEQIRAVIEAAESRPCPCIRSEECPLKRL